MRTLGRVLAVGLAVLAATVGVLYLAVPENRSVEDGPADPALAVRRPIVGALRGLGLLDPPPPFARCPYLPSGQSSSVGEDRADGTHHELRMVLEREPVYRGLFWAVGDRCTYRAILLGGDRSPRRALRLCYVEDGRKVVAGESVARDPGSGADRDAWVVTGYVPRTADGYWAEEIDAAGESHSLDGWGDVEDFWNGG